MATTDDIAADGALATYEAMAPVYDDFTAHHDYELWFGGILPELKRNGLKGGRLLDVGCGTGKSFIPMLERGWEVTACDISPAMLALARKKVDDRVRLSVADMRALPVLGEFDLVWALDDALNYMLSVDELTRSLRGMAANLAPDGLLCFDLNTLHCYRTFFAEIDVRMTGDGDRIVWRGQADRDVPAGSTCEATLTLEGDPSRVAVHRQRHFAPEEVAAALRAAGLAPLSAHGHTFEAVLEQPIEETRHTKMVFVAGPSG